MRLSRLAVILLAVATSLSGCIANMGELKEALGVVEPIVPASFDPPLAKAQANATTLLVGSPVRFLSEGSKDPQGLPLTFSWDFGDDRRAAGPVAVHQYAAPGEYLVRLTVTNAEGLTDEDTLALRVGSLDRAPTAALRVLDAAGLAAARAEAGATLTFEAVAEDPEGAPLVIDWDFGDGATSRDARATHAYAAPGLYDARLTVTDAAGNVARATTRLAIDGAWQHAGAFEPAGADEAEARLLVPAGTQRVDVTLSFPANLGLHDLEVALYDAAGDEVARTSGATAPGAQGDAERTMELDARNLAPHAAGAWTARVVRESGLSVAWTLDVAVRFS